MRNLENFIIEWDALQGINWNILITHEDMFKFIEFSAKTEHKHRKIMEKPLKKEHIFDSSGQATAIIH